MIISILVCLATLFVLLWMLRRDRMSFGLPLAYMANLLLIHVPGAFAHVVGHQMLPGDEAVALGIRYTAIGSVCFVTGVWLAQSTVRVPRLYAPGDRSRFAMFCLIGGWIFVYGLAPLGRIPSLGAAIDKGGSVWMLGALLGLRGAFEARNAGKVLFWGAALMVYPLLTLVLGGFLSYGSAAVIIACAVLAISARTYGRAAAGIAVAAILGVNLFVNYFDHRSDIRDRVWGGASIEQRLESVADMFTGFHVFSPTSTKDLEALDLRLNQNFFVGVAAQRIQYHEVDFLHGGSVWEGIVALVPRALWPDKPVSAGSGHIVANLTGLRLNEDTSWGVGNVMEFYINFGVVGLVAGFLVLGWLLGLLDRQAAAAEQRGDFGTAIMNFLPAIALIQPNGSMVEMTGGAAAAFVGALAWNRAWLVWRRSRGGPRPARLPYGSIPRSRGGAGS